MSEVTEKLVLAEAASLSLQNRVEKLELSQSEREMVMKIGEIQIFLLFLKY